MKRWLSAPTTIIILMFLAFTSNAIVSAKMYELRLRIHKDQIFDFRFSSELMRAKLASLIPHREDLQQEVRTSISESTVLRNPGPIETESPGLFQRAGLRIVNAVRVICLKAGINLWDDVALLGRIQKGFFLERNELYLEASNEFSEIESLQMNTQTDERAFVLLHHSYCLAVLGDEGKAIPKLEGIIREFSGTIFEDDARLILRLLQRGVRSREDIFRKYKTAGERARALFEDGQYARAVEEWKSESNLSEDERYQRAFALEKTGKYQDATREFINLASNENSPAARKANRRLLVIGFAYSGGSELKKLALQNSVRLQDSQFAEEIQNVSAKGIPFKPANSVDSPEELINGKSKALDTIVQQVSITAVPTEHLSINLLDGRIFHGISGNRDRGEFRLRLETGSELSVPFIMLDQIQSSSGSLKVEVGSDHKRAFALRRKGKSIELLDKKGSVDAIEGSDNFLVEMDAPQ